MRLQARRKNRTVTELEEQLTMMPLSVAGDGMEESEGMVPRTGREIRGLDRG